MKEVDAVKIPVVLVNPRDTERGREFDVVIDRERLHRVDVDSDPDNWWLVVPEKAPDA